MKSFDELRRLEEEIKSRLEWMGEIDVVVQEATSFDQVRPMLLVTLTAVDDNPSSIASGTDNLWEHIDGFAPGFRVAHHVDPAVPGHFYGHGNTESFLFIMAD